MAVVMATSYYGSHIGEPRVSSEPSRRFYVRNIDDKGRIIHIGYLQVTETEIVFRYEHHPAHISRWSLSTIRKYGVNVDGDVFAFEVGRRSPDGEGMYAFRTQGMEACEIRQRVDYYTHSSTSSSPVPPLSDKFISC